MAVVEMVAFIDDNRDRFGSSCMVLTEHGCQTAPKAYLVARKRPQSARATTYTVHPDPPLGRQWAGIVAELVRCLW